MPIANMMDWTKQHLGVGKPQSKICDHDGSLELGLEPILLQSIAVY
jgi:hypothetical protein